MFAADQQKLDGAIASAARLARTIVPDLAARPLYIIQPAAGSLVTRQITGRRLGMYFAGLDSALQRQIKSEGRWRGPGVCIVVDALACFATAADDDDAQRKVLGITLHELAHWLDLREPDAAPTHDDLVAAIKESKRVETEPQQFSQAFLLHGESFIRLCCHLWYRAAHGGGCILRAHCLGFGRDYDGLEYLDSPATYIDALGDELQRCQDLPLRTVAALPSRKRLQNCGTQP